MSSRANETDYDGNIVVGWQDDEVGGRQGAVWIDGVQSKLFYEGQPVGEASDEVPLAPRETAFVRLEGKP